MFQGFILLEKKPRKWRYHMNFIPSRDFSTKLQTHHFHNLIRRNNFHKTFQPYLSFTPITNQCFRCKLWVVLFLKKRKLINKFVYFEQVWWIDFQIFIKVIESKYKFNLCFYFSFYMKSRKQKKKKLKIYPFGLDFLHLLFKKISNSRIKRMLSKKDNLVKILYFQRF